MRARKVDVSKGRGPARWARASVLAVLASGAACATAPPAPRADPITYEQKLAWIFRLEDQRILAVPAPPPPPDDPQQKGRRPPPPAAAPGPDLTVLVTDAEPRIRRRAAVAIGRVGLKEGLPALTPLLADPDGEVRQAAAFSVGLIGEASAAPLLLPLLDDPDPMVRARAADGLGLTGAKDAAPAVAKMAAGYARSPAVAAMEPDDDRWPAAPEAEAFKIGLFALVRLGVWDALASAALDAGGAPVSTWWPVSYALQRINDPRAVPALKQLAQVKARYTPAFAARGLGAAKDASAGEVLLAMADPAARPREVVASAIRALGELGVRQAAPRLAQLAADVKADPNLRLEAVTALGSLEAVEQLPYVQDLMTDEWPAMRAAATRAAAAIDAGRFTLILSGLQIDRHWTGRAALADALGRLEGEVVVARLLSMLDDEDRRVIPAVLRSLARVQAPGVDEILVRHLKEPDFVVREAAATLLGERKPADGLPALRAAYETGLPDAAYGARAAAIAAMAAYAGPEAIEGVRLGLADKDWAVRVRTLELLQKLQPGADHRLAIRPVPNVPPMAYDDPQLSSPPYSPHVFIETERGTIEFELAVLDAPQTARSFMTLARKGFFNGLQVHRVVPNFVVQDGDPRGDGEGGPGYTIRDELNDRQYVRGTVGMALAWRDTGGSQFFITHSPQPHLNGRYTVFGHVVDGMDVVDRIQVGDVIQRIRVWDGNGWE